jgi:hypothetical protein
MNFEFFYVIDCELILNSVLLTIVTRGFRHMADLATDHDQSAWSLHIHGSDVEVGFRRKCDRDRFVEIYKSVVQRKRPRSARKLNRRATR